MAHNSYRNVQSKHKNTARRHDTYIEGNTVRKFNVVEEIKNPTEVKQLSHTTRKNRDKALYMNLGYVVFLAAALLSAAMILISYIRIQSDIIISVRNIARLKGRSSVTSSQPAPQAPLYLVAGHIIHRCPILRNWISNQKQRLILVNVPGKAYFQENGMEDHRQQKAFRVICKGASPCCNTGTPAD